MTETEAELIRAIHDNPDDDDLRLVYADYLDDQHDPRGEFLRIQVEMARRDCVGDRRSTLYTQEHKLLETHFAEWTKHLQPFDPKKVDIDFVRGFPELIMIQVGGKAEDFEVLRRAS